MGDFLYKHMSAIKSIVLGAALVFGALILSGEDLLPTDTSPTTEKTSVVALRCQDYSANSSAILIIDLSSEESIIVEISSEDCKLVQDAFRD